MLGRSKAKKLRVAATSEIVMVNIHIVAFSKNKHTYSKRLLRSSEVANFQRLSFKFSESFTFLIRKISVVSIFNLSDPYKVDARIQSISDASKPIDISWNTMTKKFLTECVCEYITILLDHIV